MNDASPQYQGPIQPLNHPSFKSTMRLRADPFGSAMHYDRSSEAFPCQGPQTAVACYWGPPLQTDKQ